MPFSSNFFSRDFSEPKSIPVPEIPEELRALAKRAKNVESIGGGPFEETNVKPMPQESGDKRRKDAGKDAGFWLIPPDSLTQLAEVYAIGAKKYSPRGWEDGMEWSRIVDPMFRHILKYMKGETHDATDGQHHMASVAWAALALMEYERTHPELDDLKRPGREDRGWPEFMGMDHDG